MPQRIGPCVGIRALGHAQPSGMAGVRLLLPGSLYEAWRWQREDGAATLRGFRRHHPRGILDRWGPVQHTWSCMGLSAAHEVTACRGGQGAEKRAQTLETGRLGFGFRSVILACDLPGRAHGFCPSSMHFHHLVSHSVFRSVLPYLPNKQVPQGQRWRAGGLVESRRVGRYVSGSCCNRTP